ncbi:MAG: SH3 domain-containing protein [Anaerolineae bacterium]|nr:SH3 domain-containing protein [Anaerolineae bacterium]
MPRRFASVFWPVLFCLALASLITLPAALLPVTAQGPTGVVLDNLNLRAGPGSDQTILTTLPLGTTVVIQGRNAPGDWLFVAVSGTEGWVSSRYVELAEGLTLDSLPVVTGQGGSGPGTLGGGAPVEQANAWPVVDLQLRSGPSSMREPLGVVTRGSGLVLEAISDDDGWALVHTADGTARGWVRAGYLSLPVGLELTDLPVSSAIVSGIQPTPTPAPTQLATLTPTDYAAIEARLDTLPILPTVLPDRVYALFETGQALGQRADVFTTIGDCHTDTHGFLVGFGEDDYDLGPFAALQPTIDFFLTPPRPGMANSWVNARDSIAANSAFPAGAPLDATWSDPVLCETGESPLACELRLTHPAVALVMVGTVDIELYDPAIFAIYYRPLVEAVMETGVIPVLYTIPAHPEHRWERALGINAVIMDTAAREGLPLVNFYRAVRNLPNRGLAEDNYHLLWWESGTYFNRGDHLHYGLAMRNLVTLQVLDQLRREVLSE